MSAFDQIRLRGTALCREGSRLQGDFANESLTPPIKECFSRWAIICSITRRPAHGVTSASSDLYRINRGRARDGK